MSENQTRLIVYLENGWGNMMLELAVGLAFAKFLKRNEEKIQVEGLISPLFFSTHKTIFSKEHSDLKLPGPFDMESIFPGMKFISKYEPDEHTKSFSLHESPKLSDFDNWKKILLRADWMSDNVRFLLPILKQYPDLLNCMKPAQNISEYIHNKYIDVPPQNMVVIHVRVRQPGDIMANIRHPNPEWFVEAVNKARNETLDKILIVSGISTAHKDGHEYLTSIIDRLMNAFPMTKLLCRMNHAT